MSTLCKLEEWRAPSGIYYVNDKNHIATAANQWWFPARVLGLSIPEFVTLLHDKYKADLTLLGEDQLSYSWTIANYRHCHQFVLDYNKVARKKDIKL